MKEWNSYQPVGTCTLLDLEPLIDAANSAATTKLPRYLAHCPTMIVPKDVHASTAPFDCFLALLNCIHRHQTVLCSGLGTLTGCVAEGICARQMAFALQMFERSLQLRDQSQNQDSNDKPQFLVTWPEAILFADHLSKIQDDAKTLQHQVNADSCI